MFSSGEVWACRGVSGAGGVRRHRPRGLERSSGVGGVAAPRLVPFFGAAVGGAGDTAASARCSLENARWAKARRRVPLHTRGAPPVPAVGAGGGAAAVDVTEKKRRSPRRRPPSAAQPPPWVFFFGAVGSSGSFMPAARQQHPSRFWRLLCSGPAAALAGGARSAAAATAAAAAAHHRRRRCRWCPRWWARVPCWQCFAVCAASRQRGARKQQAQEGSSRRGKPGQCCF